MPIGQLPIVFRGWHNYWRRTAFVWKLGLIFLHMVCQSQSEPSFRRCLAPGRFLFLFKDCFSFIFLHHENQNMLGRLDGGYFVYVWATCICHIPIHLSNDFPRLLAIIINQASIRTNCFVTFTFKHSDVFITF